MHRRLSELRPIFPCKTPTVRVSPKRIPVTARRNPDGRLRETTIIRDEAKVAIVNRSTTAAMSAVWIQCMTIGDTAGSNQQEL